jgi:hypothetical protein
MSAGWNKLTWGFGTWGLLGNITVSLTGQAFSASLGNETSKTDYTNTPTGQALTATLSSPSSVTGTTSAYPTGEALTFTLANADAGPDAMLTTNLASISLGSVSAYNSEGWGRYFWGQWVWGEVGDWANVSVTGQALTAALGNETVEAHATVSPSGLSIAQVTLGQVDPAPDAFPLGNGALLALGTLAQGSAKTVTGEAMTMSLASVTIDLNTPVDVTGIGASIALASVTAYTDIDVIPTGFGLTMGVGSGSALIWNDVDTGSAPITPPGWQDVAA